jgi:hypothetical protein
MPKIEGEESDGSWKPCLPSRRESEYLGRDFNDKKVAG